MRSSSNTPFQDRNANTSNNNSSSRQGEGLARRSTNPFASWMDPIDLDLDPFNAPSSQSQPQHRQEQQHHRCDTHRHQQSITGLSELPHPLFPSFHISGPTSSQDHSSSPPTLAITHGRPDLQRQHHLRSYTPPSLDMPTPPMPTVSSSFNSPYASTPSPSSNGNGSALPYTPYQPPPIRQDGLTSQQSLALRDLRLLEPEPVSPSASTLVGSPMTPHGNGRRPFSWLGNSGDQPPNGTKGSPEDPACSSSGGGNVASAYRLGALGSKRKSLSNSKGDQGFSSSVGPANAARTLGYHNHSGSGEVPPFSSQHSHYHHINQQHPAGGGGWEPHVSVMMDEISLDSFVPSDTPPKKSHHGRIYNKGSRSRDGRASPAASDFDRSSNTSMVTLLAQTNTSSNSSSSTTLFGGFMSKSKSHKSFKKLNDSQEDLIEAAQQQQHQTITMSTGGKAYSKRPKDKMSGKKGSGGGSGGDGGNSDRKALFSNERTLVHWIKFGILLGTMALTLCNFGRIGSLAFYIGSSILLVAMSTLGYAIMTFHYRDRSLSRRLKAAMARKRAKRNKKGGPGAEAVDPATLIAKEICYYDRKGPTIVCCLLIFACSINFYLSMAYGSTMNGPGGLSYFHVNEF